MFLLVSMCYSCWCPCVILADVHVLWHSPNHSGKCSLKTPFSSIKQTDRCHSTLFHILFSRKRLMHCCNTLLYGGWWCGKNESARFGGTETGQAECLVVGETCKALFRHTPGLKENSEFSAEGTWSYTGKCHDSTRWRWSSSPSSWYR